MLFTCRGRTIPRLRPRPRPPPRFPSASARRRWPWLDGELDETEGGIITSFPAWFKLSIEHADDALCTLPPLVTLELALWGLPPWERERPPRRTLACSRQSRPRRTQRVQGNPRSQRTLDFRHVEQGRFPPCGSSPNTFSSIHTLGPPQERRGVVRLRGLSTSCLPALVTSVSMLFKLVLIRMPMLFSGQAPPMKTAASSDCAAALPWSWPPFLSMSAVCTPSISSPSPFMYDALTCCSSTPPTPSSNIPSVKSGGGSPSKSWGIGVDRDMRFAMFTSQGMGEDHP